MVSAGTFEAIERRRQACNLNAIARTKHRVNCSSEWLVHDQFHGDNAMLVASKRALVIPILFLIQGDCQGGPELAVFSFKNAYCAQN
jgi:hypothetical protein